MIAASGYPLEISKTVGLCVWGVEGNLCREQLEKQSVGTHSNPEVGSRQFHHISQEREELCMHLGW